MGGARIEIITKLREIAAVNRRRTVLGADFAFDETAQAFARIAREIGFTDLAVVDDIEAAVKLLLDDFGDSAAYPLSESSFVDGLAADLRRVHLLQVGRLRQCAGMGRENPFCTALHFSILHPAGLKICAWKKSVKQQRIRTR